MSSASNLYDPESLQGIMRGTQGPRAVLLLGAGASVKSGVPLAADLVSMAAKWAYCRDKGRSFDDPNVMRSDWWPWLCQQGWFDPQEPVPTQYPTAVERLLHPQESRRQFFLRVLSPASPSPGYAALARLVAAGAIRHILTVNFDALVRRACDAERSVLHVDTIECPDDLVKFSLDPVHAQLVYLHGAVARYEDRNLEHETQRLDDRIRDAVLPLMRDHPLVVVGYRGAEPSVMTDLLMRAANDHGFRHGLHWCVVRGESPGDLVRALQDRLGTNFRYVEIPDFDRAMTGWAADLRPAPAPPVDVDAIEPVSDLRPAAGVDVGDLDMSLLDERLAAYADAMGLPRVDPNDSEAFMARLEQQRLVRRADNAVVLTQAANLLFSKEDVVQLEIEGDGVSARLNGNVFSVLGAAIEAIAEINQPFRLKGPTSQDVRRFDPRAIKEVLVNSLVHRDYAGGDPIRVRISSRELTVVSPGGLIGTISVDRLGEPGVRAYRNPVVADLLYGCGAMDKAGSGLADVRRWTRQAGGDATFGPSQEGDRFVASLHARDLDPDPVTRTADAGEVERFVTNALPVELRGVIRSIPVHEAYRREIYEQHDDEVVLPGFAMQPGRLLTFAELASGDSPLARHAQGDIETIEPADLTDDADHERLLVQLLNSTVLAWARANGLRSEASSQRLWFPSDDGQACEVTYHGRVREATRTVTKPKLSRSSGAVRYWEHEGVRFRFRRYGSDWLLHLVPCFVFTKDGEGALLQGPRVGPLATRRIARDFNPQVQHDLFFWRWVLTQGRPEYALDDGAVWVRSEFLATDVLDAPAAPGLSDGDQDEPPEEDITEEVAALVVEERVQE